jgi:hypothetical protein
MAAVAVQSRLISRRIQHCHYVGNGAPPPSMTLWGCAGRLRTRRGPSSSDELASVYRRIYHLASDERIARLSGGAGRRCSAGFRSRLRSAPAHISTALGTWSSASSTRSSAVAGLQRAMTSSPLTTLPSFNSHRSGYGCALNASTSWSLFRAHPWTTVQPLPI